MSCRAGPVTGRNRNQSESEAKAGVGHPSERALAEGRVCRTDVAGGGEGSSHDKRASARRMPGVRGIASGVTARSNAAVTVLR